MKSLLALFLTTQMLFAVLPFTLENADNFRLFFMNESEFLDNRDSDELKKIITDRLAKEGFILNERDPITFFAKVESLHLDDNAFVYIQIGLGEEVMTHRKGKIETMAFTYHHSDFIETDDPFEDTKESLHFLLDEFMALYKEDML